MASNSLQTRKFQILDANDSGSRRLTSHEADEIRQAARKIRAILTLVEEQSINSNSLRFELSHARVSYVIQDLAQTILKTVGQLKT